MRTLVRVMILGTILTLLIACQASKEATTEPEKTENKQEINVAIGAQPPTLDTHTSTASATRDVGQHMFETLVTLNASYQAVPMLAESVDISDDHKTYTFHLKEGVTFHNGKEMIAEDVVASMERWKQHDAMALSLLENSTFEEEDDYTVVLKLEEPSSLILPIIAGSKQIAAIMPKEIVEAAGESEITEYIGTGPFQLKEWKQDQYIHLKKHEDYKTVDEPADGLAGKKKPLVDEIYFTISPDSSTRLVGLQTGEYDVALDLSYDDYEQVEQNENIESIIELHSSIAIVFNKKEGLLSDQTMRQAFNALLDVEQILLAAFSDEAFFRVDPGYVFKEQEDWYTDAGKEHYNQNDQQYAKRLLKEAGYDGEELTLMVSRDYEQYYNAGVVVQEQLESLGVEVNLEVVDWPTQQERMHDADEYDAFITGFTTVATPLHLLYLNNSWPGWTDDPEITDLLKKMNTAESIEKAKRYWEELQERAWVYLPVVNIGHTYTFNGISNELTGYENFLGPNLWNTSIEQ